MWCVPGSRQKKKRVRNSCGRRKFFFLVGRFLAEEKFTSGPVTPHSRFSDGFLFIIANAKCDVFRPLLQRELKKNQIGDGTLVLIFHGKK